MKIIISTVKRPNGSDYLTRCIESIRQDWDGEIHLVVGGRDTSYIKRHDVKLHLIGDLEQGDGVQKAGFGYQFALSLFPDEDCLVVEDDAVFIKGWYGILQELLVLPQERRYVISLISPWTGATSMPNMDRPSLQPYIYTTRLSYENLGDYPVANVITYSNTTAIYYPSNILKTRLPKFIKRFVVNDEGVYDLVAGYWFFRYNIPVYIAVPNLLKGVETADSAMGSTIKRFHVNYEDWDYKSW